MAFTSGYTADSHPRRALFISSDWIVYFGGYNPPTGCSCGRQQKTACETGASTSSLRPKWKAKSAAHVSNMKTHGCPTLEQNKTGSENTPTGAVLGDYSQRKIERRERGGHISGPLKATYGRRRILVYVKPAEA